MMRDFYLKDHLICSLTDEQAKQIGGDALTLSYYVEETSGLRTKVEEPVRLSTLQSVLDKMTGIITGLCLTIGPPPKPLQE